MQMFAAASAPFSLVGAGISAWSTLEGGKEAADMGKQALLQAREEAKATRAAGAYASREKRKEGQQYKGTAIANMVARGGMLNGSNIEILAESAANFEADARLIAHNYKVEANRTLQQGLWARYQGQVERRASRIRAFGNLMGDVGRIAAMQGIASMQKQNTGTVSWAKGGWAGGNSGAGNPAATLSYGSGMAYV